LVSCGLFARLAGRAPFAVATYISFPPSARPGGKFRLAVPLRRRPPTDRRIIRGVPAGREPRPASRAFPTQARGALHRVARISVGAKRAMFSRSHTIAYISEPGQEVLLVAATDPASVEALLRQRVGTRLCVVHSRWTRAEFDAVRGHLRAHHRSWNLFRLGQLADKDGQPYIAVELGRVSLETALWAASMQPGILSLHPWLRPTHEKSSNS